MPSWKCMGLSRRMADGVAHPHDRKDWLSLKMVKPRDAHGKL